MTEVEQRIYDAFQEGFWMGANFRGYIDLSTLLKAAWMASLTRKALVNEGNDDAAPR